MYIIQHCINAFRTNNELNRPKAEHVIQFFGADIIYFLRYMSAQIIYLF